MPRIPNHQINDDWDDPDDFEIQEDELRDRLGRKLPRREREEELHRKEVLRKRHKEE